MRGEIVSIGTELLLGHITDTNASWLAQELSKLGIDCFYISQLGDNLHRLTEHLRRAWDRSDLIVMSGGVGPTEDDLTREAISGLLGEQMHVVPELEADLRQFFVRRGVTMPESNVKQATLIPSASTLNNPVGTAPGWWVERDGRIIVAMPGVPGEMFRMWEQEVIPRLQTRAGQSVILTRTYKVIGIGESAVEELLRELLASTNPTIATYAKSDGVHVRTSAKATSVATAGTHLDDMEPRVRAALGTAIYGMDNQTLAGVTASLLASGHETVAVSEEFTGGSIAAELAEHGLGQFVGGIVNAEPAVTADLGDRTSPAFIRATVLARRASQLFQGSYAIGQASDTAPRSGTSPGRHIHTVVTDRDGTEVARAYRLDTTAPRIIKTRAVLYALNLLREHLLTSKDAS